MPPRFGACYTLTQEGARFPVTAFSEEDQSIEPASAQTRLVSSFPLWLCVFFLVLFCFSTFAFVASVVLLIAALFGYLPALDDIHSGLWIRVGLFNVVYILAAASTLGMAARIGRLTPVEPRHAAITKHLLALVPVLLLVSIFAFPRLALYPWAAPDEVHHLNVAKNIAEHGRYASGTPAAGFRDFDPFDSVGPPVLLPIAGVFKVAGAGIVQARLVMACFALLFFSALWFFLRPVYGTLAATCGTLFSAISFSSIYLGRTLYGEMPALFFFLAGLALWRRALPGRNISVWGLLAGLCFGLAILSKSILLLSAFCFLGALFYDRAAARSIRLGSLAGPAIGTLLPLAVWWGMKAIFSGDGAKPGEGILDLYQHYLLFGVEPVLGNLQRSVLAHPAVHLAAAAGVLYAVHTLFQKRYDPPTIVLFLVMTFYALWWLCFTPGQLPRYLWSSYAIAGALTGILAGDLARVAAGSGAMRRRLIAGLGAMALVSPTLLWASGQMHEIMTNREMEDDYRVCEALLGLNPTQPPATTFYPLRGTLQFLGSIEATVGDDSLTLLDQSGTVAVLRETVPALLPEGVKSLSVGRYVILTQAETVTPEN